MEAFKFGTKTYLTGLNWEALKGVEKAKDEIKDIATDNPDSCFAVFVEGFGGSVLGLAQDKQKIKLPSAANVLAQCNRFSNDNRKNKEIPEVNWVMVESLEDEKFWVGVIQDGVPLPGYDVVVPWDEAANLLKDLLEGNGYVILANSQEVLDFVGGTATTKLTSLDELSLSVKPMQKVVRLSGANPIIGYGASAAGVLVLLVVAYSWYSSYMEEQEAIVRARMVAEADRVQEEERLKKIEEKKAEEKKKFIASSIAEIRLNLQNGTPNYILNRMAEIYENISFVNNGWDLTGVFCDVDRRAPRCKVKLTRTELGTHRGLLELFPNAKFNKDDAQYELRGAPFPANEVILENLLTNKDLYLGPVSDWESITTNTKVKYVFENPKQVSVSRPLVEPSMEEGQPDQPLLDENGVPLIEKISLDYSTGEWAFAGTDLWQIKDVGKYLPTRSFAITSVEINTNRGILAASGTTWKIQGKYWTRGIDSLDWLNTLSLAD